MMSDDDIDQNIGHSKKLTPQMQLKCLPLVFVEKTNEGQIHGKRLVTQLKAQNLYQEIKF